MLWWSYKIDARTGCSWFVKMLTQPLYKTFVEVAQRRCLVQYTSGLFVDTSESISPAFYIKPVAPILALTGDIGLAKTKHTREFLKYCNRNWDTTLYVPGKYELKELAATAELCNEFPNIRLLNRNTYVSAQNSVVFIGAPMVDDGADMDSRWMRSEFLNWRDFPYKIVALTNGSPVKKGQNNVTPYVNAWVCGGREGSAQIRFDSGSVLAYNNRGSYYYYGMNNWTRRAVVAVPENDELEEE